MYYGDKAPKPVRHLCFIMTRKSLGLFGTLHQSFLPELLILGLAVENSESQANAMPTGNEDS